MVSSPSAYRASPSGEKTRLRSRSGSGSRQSAQSELSADASTAIVSQRSVTKGLQRGDRLLDLLLAVGRRGKERLELRRREVDALLEQVSEERGVAFGVAALRVFEAADRRVRHEEGEQDTDPLNAT